MTVNRTKRRYIATMTSTSATMKYEIASLTHDNWDTFEFPMQQLLVRLGLWKYVKETTKSLDLDLDKEWEEGCAAARAEIALHVSPDLMHIVRSSEDPTKIWEKFKETLGWKGCTT